MNKVNYLALGAAALVVISIFLPWVEVSPVSSTSDVSQSFQPVIISGVAIGYGIFGLLVSLLGAFMAYKEFKWAFLAGIINFVDGYGYLHGWFGAATRDSGNYGDVTSMSSVDHKFGLYLFIIASLAFMIFTLKNYKPRKATEAVLPPEPDIKGNQPAAPATNTAASQIYQPSKIQTMTTQSSETPTGSEPTETPKVPVQAAETASEQPTTPATEPVVETPTVSAQPIETPKEPVQAVVTEPAPVVNQAPTATAAPQQPVAEPEKKSSTSKILLIILAIVLVGAAVFVMTNNSSQKSKDKTEQSVNGEKARLDSIVNQVNEAVTNKKYDEALLKINSITWLYEPDANKGYVDQYNRQREDLRNTVEQLKTNQSLEDQKQAAEKAEEASKAAEQPGDSIQ